MSSTPRCETLVYRLLTPRSTHSRAQLSSPDSSVPTSLRWVTSRGRYYAYTLCKLAVRKCESRYTPVHIRECRCSVYVVRVYVVDTLPLRSIRCRLLPLSLSLTRSLPLFDSTLNPPSSITVCIPTSVTFRECDTEFVDDGTEPSATLRYDNAQAKSLTDVVAPSISDIPSVSVRVLHGGSSVRLRNQELRSQRRAIVEFVSSFSRLGLRIHQLWIDRGIVAGRNIVSHSKHAPVACKKTQCVFLYSTETHCPRYSLAWCPLS